MRPFLLSNTWRRPVASARGKHRWLAARVRDNRLGGAARRFVTKNREPSLPTHAALPAALSVLLLGTTWAEDRVDFERQVKPIFQSRCIECHGPDDQQSSLRLDDRASLLRGGDSGTAAITPGRPNESFLLRVVRARDPDIRMPPEEQPLDSDQIQLIERWIRQGAGWPGQMDARADDIKTDHWSFQPIAGQSPTEYPRGGMIDGYIERRLRQAGLSRSPPADGINQVRRVSLVLTGLPPTTQEMEDFLADPRGIDAAYASLVDRLLASPRYGERWAQHWLDVIRWAETVGFETNNERPSAWPYRDWVIDSLNEDKPYDRFVFEQIAGDTVGQDAALGFLVAGPANLPGQIGRDEEAMRQARQDELDEVIRTVSQAVLGLTVGCARCHHHKFDPILQKDYYAMQAIFAGLNYGRRRLRGIQNDAWTERVPAAREKLARSRKELESLRQHYKLKKPLDGLHTEWFPPVLAKAVRMEIDQTGNGSPASLYELQVWAHDATGIASRNVALASAGATPRASSFALANQTRHFDNLVDGSVDRRQAFPWVAEKAGPAWIQIDFAKAERIDRVVWDRGSSVPAQYTIKVLLGSNHWRTIADTTDRLPREDDIRKAELVELRGLTRDQIAWIVAKNAEVRAAQKEVARLSAGPQVFAASFNNTPGQTWVLRRGDPMQRADLVAPAIPKILGDLGLSMDEPERSRRLKFAAHVTAAGHPLTARVVVNRVWQHHFGQGLVDTPSDFGQMGSRPSHPELLDALTADFLAGGWSLKTLHRKIVLSQTFRQSSRPCPEAQKLDADCRLLWRFPPRRLEAEAIRDSILQVSGKLNPAMGGPGFNLFRQRGGLSGYTPVETFDPSGWRRMIYAHKIRMQSADIFGAFDCPDAGQMKPKRTRSITPTQSLGLFNSPFVIRQAGFFADRVQNAVGDRIDRQVQRAFTIALSRSPSDHELKRMIELVQGEGLLQLCRVLMNTSEFISIQ